MKLNIISDIHAIVHTGKVYYALPYNYTINKYRKIFDTFYEYYNNNINIINEKIECINRFANIHELVSKIKICHDNDYVSSDIDYNEINQFAEFLENMKLAGIDPFYRKRLTPLPIINYITFLRKKMYDFDPAKLEPADYLIIAGDIGKDNEYDMILADIRKKTKGKFKDIFCIKGNHDYWNINKQRENTRARKQIHTINLANDKQEKIIGDYVFLGCTMWTPVPDKHKTCVEHYMNDYEHIPWFTVEQSTNLFYEYKNWLEQKIEQYKNKKIVIVTHHCPFSEMVPRRYNTIENIGINTAYSVMNSSLDNINKYNNIVLWVSGHTHVSFDKVVHNVHCIRNPIGYSDIYNYTIPENVHGNWYNTIIEI